MTRRAVCVRSAGIGALSEAGVAEARTALGVDTARRADGRLTVNRGGAGLHEVGFPGETVDDPERTNTVVEERTGTALRAI